MNKMMAFGIALCLIGMIGCKAPTDKYLLKKGGYWDIEELHYQRMEGNVLFVDTTFVDAGEMYFTEEVDREKDEDDWELEGYVQEPREVEINEEWVFVWSVFYMRADARDHVMQASNDVGFFTFVLRDWDVTKRSGNYMEWVLSTDDQTWEYKLRRRN